MDQKKSDIEFEKKVKEVFSDVLHLEHRPPQEGMDGMIYDKSAGVFEELASITKNIRPKPNDPSPSPAQYSHSEPKKEIIESSPLQILRDAFIMVSIAGMVFFLFSVAFFRFRVNGPSMEPSISHENYTMINQLAYSLGEVKRGDIVALYSPEHPDERYIKRVIAIPGDQVEIIGGWLYINDLMLDEPYLGTPDDFDYPLLTVPDDTLFVLGDNRRVSEDSRIWGPVPIDYVIGRADFVYWPLNDFGLVEHYHSSILTP